MPWQYVDFSGNLSFGAWDQGSFRMSCDCGIGRYWCQGFLQDWIKSWDVLEDIGFEEYNGFVESSGYSCGLRVGKG